MYNLEQLRMFVESAESGSFSGAARNLGKVQSAISQGIANLEIDMDVQLFDRSTRKPSLTAEGERLLAYARAVLQQSYELNTVVEAIRRREEPLIRLVIDNALLVPKLSKIFAEFGERFPASALEIRSVVSDEILAYFEKGMVDIGLMFCDVAFRQDVELCYVGDLPFHAVCSAEHPLANAKMLKAADLIPYRQLVLCGKNKKGGLVFPVISAETWSTNSFASLKLLVENGIGWSYLPEHLVNQPTGTTSLVRLPVIFDHKTWSLKVDLVTPNNQPKGPALRWLYETLKEFLDI